MGGKKEVDEDRRSWESRIEERRARLRGDGLWEQEDRKMRVLLVIGL